MLICIPKINFITHFFLKILHFKESFSILAHKWRTRICQIWAGSEISITILVFILDYFQEKTNDKIFQKNPQKPILGPFWVLFLTNLGKNEFSWIERALSVFKYSSVYCHAKNQEELMSHSWEKCQTDKRTDEQAGRWTDRQTKVIL